MNAHGEVINSGVSNFGPVPNPAVLRTVCSEPPPRADA